MQSNLYTLYIPSLCIHTCVPIFQGCQMIHELYTDVPKLIISSSCIRLLNVVGQGTITTKSFGLYYSPKGLDIFTPAVLLTCSCDHENYISNSQW